MLQKLDSCVTATAEDSDDDDFSVVVEHRCLVDEDPRSLVMVRDLLNLPRKLTSTIMTHPVITTFVEQRWQRTKNFFLLAFFLYLVFVILFSAFLSLMYTKNNEADNFIRIPVQLPAQCDALIPSQRLAAASATTTDLRSRAGLGAEDAELAEAIDVAIGGGVTGDIATRGGAKSGKGKAKGRNKNEKDDGEYKIKLEVVKERKNKTRRTRAQTKHSLFSGCSARRRYTDLDLCAVEVLLLAAILLLLVLELTQMLSLGREYFLELENWFELLILVLAVCTLSLKSELDILAIVASVGICLAWIELIFMFGRYPSLGGTFNIMYYSITKRVIKTALGLLLLVVAFAFAFFIIHFDNSSESFESVQKSVAKSFVMVLGEFEFDDLWESSRSGGSGLTQAFTLLLLVGLIVLGTIVMINLIVAIIITDIDWLHKVSKLQVLRNQVSRGLQTHFLPQYYCVHCRRTTRCRSRLSSPCSSVCPPKLWTSRALSRGRYRI